MFEKFQTLQIDDLIAKKPASPRDSSKLMVLRRNNQQIESKIFADILQYFDKGDCLVINNTKVFAAKILGKKKTGGAVEVLLIAPTSDKKTWKTLSMDYKPDMEIFFEDGVVGKFLDKTDDNEFLMEFNTSDILEYADKHGNMPLPPYIEKARKISGEKTKIEKDKDDYQTIYAKETGSIAAPTAGFHFTENLLEKLKDKGVQIVEITLHVGFGTFKPLKTSPEDHQMLPEFAVIDESTAKIINDAKKSGGRLFATGTTCVRTLESFADPENKGEVLSGQKNTDLFIYPPYKFKVIDCLITNFHLADSTPICLASAFLDDTDFLLEAYRQAVEEKYRFYSFGDAMLIL